MKLRKKIDKQKLPPFIYNLYSIGVETQEVIDNHFSGVNQKIDNFVHPDFLEKLAESLKSSGWTDKESAKLITILIDYATNNNEIDEYSFIRWVLSHRNDANAVVDCLKIIPPEEINIIRILSRVGNQKLVFLATWNLTQNQVVLKNIIAPQKIRDVILQRESQAHPFSMSHPNIIETHILKNNKGERYLVERYLREVLSDDWRSGGIQEAANLLYDITDALNYLHNDLDGVHGDIKPDNIGKDGDDYILLDFGVYRPAALFTLEATATGSLRTRAPELLETDEYKSPHKVDIWALGATVYNALIGRFPLFDKGEAPPRPINQDERVQFEQELKRRVENEYNNRVTFNDIPNPIKDILKMALERDPEKRSNAAELMEEAEKNLAAFLRSPTNQGRFSPSDELKIYANYLPSQEILRLMPENKRQTLIQQIKDLKNKKGFCNEEMRQIDNLLESLS